MLAPGSANDPIQFIDARDLAEFMSDCAEQRIVGRYNLCNKPRTATIGSLLDVAKAQTKSDARFVWANAEFLAANGLIETGEVPIWAPPTGEYAGTALVDPTRAIAKGLRFRPVETTVADTLAWHRTRPEEQRQKLRAGLSAEREAELLAKLRG